MHQFFLPELVYILQTFGRHAYQEVVDVILKKSWMKNINMSHQSRINHEKVDSIKIPLKPYQKDFIYLYDEKKQKYDLKGYILAFEMGLGKSITSLALMEGLDKDCVIIVAPKSTMKSVWKNEIENHMPGDTSIWMPGELPKKAKYYIVNYEAIPKLSLVEHVISQHKNIGIIVDECHNFRASKAKRVINLLEISKKTKCEDILLMSGTPIKALGSEMIPALMLIDKRFDNDALNIFKSSFGVGTDYAIEILRNRLGLMMHRKTKLEVLHLPEKTFHEINIKIPNGDKFTAENVKEIIVKFINERTEYYKSNYSKYENDFNECINFLKMSPLQNDPDFQRYLAIIDYLKIHGFTKERKAEIFWAREYEDTVLINKLPVSMRKKFRESKSVIKYIDLKIMGEVLGGLLQKLRAEMFSEMIKHSPTCEIIGKAEKKTVCFTMWVDVAKTAMEYIKTTCREHPILVSGETSKNIKELIIKFKTDPIINPIVATIQTLATGVTLNEANTVIFLNKPWRHVDFQQAVDRVHRIGQDTNVEIYTYVLDTGGKQNLSTRMEEIFTWSKELFEGLMGEKIPEKYMNENFIFKF